MPADPVRGRRWADHRRTLEAIGWKYRTSSPWRDLPDELGPFQTAHKRLIRWAVDGTWERVLAALLATVDAEDDTDWTVSVDSTPRRPGRPCVFLTRHPYPPAASGHPRGHSTAVRPGRSSPEARPTRRPPARLRQRGMQAAEHRRAVHQPPQAAARPGHTNRQARDRLPGSPAPRGHPHLGPTLAKQTEPRPRHEPQLTRSTLCTEGPARQAVWALPRHPLLCGRTRSMRSYPASPVGDEWETSGR